MPHSLFISDLHLCASHPESMAQFRKFIAGASAAEALYILGDLFDFWASDDDLGDEFHAQVVAELHSLALQGVRIFLLHGNRDLLMGAALANACQATLLQDPVLIDLYGTPTLLTHGDLLCTDDIAYMVHRAQVHDPDFQKQFLSRPLAERKAYIAELRRRSIAEQKNKQSAIMDVNDAALASLLRAHGYPRLIHGHTHRKNLHLHSVDGHTCERYVLGDWYQLGSALRCDNNGIRWEAIAEKS